MGVEGHDNQIAISELKIFACDPKHVRFLLNAKSLNIASWADLPKLAR